MFSLHHHPTQRCHVLWWHMGAVVILATDAQAAATSEQHATPHNKAFKVWKKPSTEVLKQSLTAEQYKVTQQCGTEVPFHNAYWNNHEEGIYVDRVSGEPLFSSKDKFDSGTGWPSFAKFLEKNVVEKADNAQGRPRTEVRSLHGDSHLGHVFKDGPAEKGGLRYCINSAALRFIPAAQLKEEGYGAYAAHFESKPPTHLQQKK